jgi:cation:H+ antiporter
LKWELKHPLYLFISFVPVILFLDGLLSFSDGLILIVLYLLFLKNTLESKERAMSMNNLDKREAGKQFLILLASIFVVILSAEFAVDKAVNIANSFNLFQSFIGGTIIALSTSLPELALTLVAIRKRVTDIALGNLIGSNVVNITLILGLNILINPFTPNTTVAASIFAFIFLSSGFLIYKFLTSRVLDKNDGLVLLAMYGLYLIVLSSVQLTA